MRRETWSILVLLAGAGVMLGVQLGRVSGADEGSAMPIAAPETVGAMRLAVDVAQEVKPCIEWAVDQATEEAVPDASGQGFEARLEGKVRVVANGEGHKALCFDGTGDNEYWRTQKQNCGLSIAKRMDRGFKELSVEAWVRKEAAGWMPVVYRGSWDETWGFGLYMEWSSGKAVFGHYDHTGHKSGVQSESVVQDGKWHHVVGVMEPKDEGSYVYRIFVDGKLDAEQIGTWGVAEAPADSGILMIAYPNSSGSDNPYKGEIGGVAIFDVALTPATVKARYEAQRPAVAP
jgi:hypothetical protein